MNSLDGTVVVLGTRPEIIKLAPIVAKIRPEPRLVHTGQHYDVRLSDSFFTAFGLLPPVTTLGVGGQSRGAQIGNATSALDELFAEISPTCVIAQGDTNSTVAAALAANARDIPLVHVEAGLRSFDRAMPEEHNRVITDHLTDLCLAPTQVSRSNLLTEGIDDKRIAITGNTVVDAVNHLLPDESARAEILTQNDVERERFALSTFHRPENVDDPERLAIILDQLRSIDLPVLLPVHPRTRAQIDRHGLDRDGGPLRLMDPIGYVQFLGLLAESALAIGDSGGVQEEVSVLKRPMVVVRRSTERPEVLDTFCTLASPEKIGAVAVDWLSNLSRNLSRLSETPSPYGDGHASERSVDAIRLLLESR
jgi:UDP-N-acetylglucosamine 2-epimerase (non-hydrolysing)